jgi:hypothetical protein
VEVLVGDDIVVLGHLMRGATQGEGGEFRQRRQSTEAGRTLRDYFFALARSATMAKNEAEDLIRASMIFLEIRAGLQIRGFTNITTLYLKNVG